MELFVDQELKDWLPQPKDGCDILEKQLVQEGGPRDPIIVWKGRGVIVDGYRRYAICQQHGLPYKTEEREFADRDAVKQWMDEYQVARRNLDSVSMSVVLKRMVDSRVRDTEERGAKESAVKEVSKQAGVSERTVQRSEKVAEALEGVAEPIRKRIMAGEIKASREAIQTLSGLPASKQVQVAKKYDDGCGSLSQALAEATGRSRKRIPADEKQTIGDTVTPNGASEGAGGKSPGGSPALQEIKEAEKRLGKAWRWIEDIFAGCTDKRVRRLNGSLRAASQILDEMHREAE